MFILPYLAKSPKSSQTPAVRPFSPANCLFQTEILKELERFLTVPEPLHCVRQPLLSFSRADGSNCYLKFPNAFSPLNLYCLGDKDRAANAFLY